MGISDSFEKAEEKGLRNSRKFQWMALRLAVPAKELTDQATIQNLSKQSFKIGDKSIKQLFECKYHTEHFKAIKKIF